MSGKPFVFVLGYDGQPLMPCTGKRARLLLERGRARVRRIKPFIIQMKDRSVNDCLLQPLEVKIDPGSKTTGICLSRTEQGVVNVISLMELEHRGNTISRALTSRAANRGGRRSRKTRYRQPRFLNRTKPKGWLPPSLRHRLETTMTWVRRLCKWVPVASLAVERVKFDVQRMQDPEISGVEYQQGTLHGFEVKEYLLEKWGRKCCYCGITDTPLEVEHIHPRSAGGSNRVSNLALACRTCNTTKGSQPVEVFLHRKPEVLARVLKYAKKPLKDAAAVNSTRNALFKALLATGLPVMTGTGAETKLNRHTYHVPKTHALDAACVGQIAGIRNAKRPHITIKCMGRGRYQRTLVDKYGFPRKNCASLPKTKRLYGIATGDLVRAVFQKGKLTEQTLLGRVVVKTSGKFVLAVGNRPYYVSYRNCKLVQMTDGYQYGSTRYEYERMGKHILAIPAIIN